MKNITVDPYLVETSNTDHMGLFKNLLDAEMVYHVKIVRIEKKSYST